MPGLPQPDHSQVCNDDPSRETYYLPTGYRRIPLDTCQGGRELEKWESKEKPCPGKEPEYARAHRGLSGFWIFVLAVLLPAGAAGGIGYWVWQHWDGKFGRIQLNDGGRSFDTDGAWVRWPVAVVSAVVAVVAAVPLLAGSLWRWAGGLFGGRSRRYTTRSSFARGRGDYAVVDEDELLGEDEDEEA